MYHWYEAWNLFFLPNWRGKLLPVTVFISFLNSASWFNWKGHKYRWGKRTTFWDIWGRILIYLKIIQMSYVHFELKIFVAFCRHTCLLTPRRKLVIFIENWNIERYFNLVALRKNIKNAFFLQNGADNYFRFWFSLHFGIPRPRVHRKPHKYW